MSDQRPKPKLKFWQAKGLLTNIADAADEFWTTLQGWFSAVTTAIDADSAPIEMVELLGWERDIERFPGEDDALFRKRVKHALANAKDAGSAAGFGRIWQRLGLGVCKQTERFDDVDWDVIAVQVREDIFAKYAFLFDTLTRTYGRTCRRYVMESILTVEIHPTPISASCENSYHEATW